MPSPTNRNTPSSRNTPRNVSSPQLESVSVTARKLSDTSEPRIRQGLTPRQRNLALLAGLSIALYTVENLIPLPIPWLRIGIGNVGVLMALYMLGPLDGFFVLLLKIIIGSLFSGRFLSPFFLFALGAGIPSYWLMAAFRHLLGRWFGPVGISVAGAVSHNLFQLAIAYLIVVQSPSIFYLAPVLVVLGTVAGFLIGAAVRAILPRIGVDSIKTSRKIESG